jgi:cellulose synthase/poly-beta-1,6-N-acetylglucosamine synthase-like glycosyltransferase
MQQQGHNVQLIRRDDRSGFKAGALQHGLTEATGDLLAVFDADFVVPRDFLQRTVHHFTDSDVGFVQACWQHINREASILTRSQAIFLDSHFLIEHAARNRSGDG